jgi:hypothetical protein
MRAIQKLHEKHKLEKRFHSKFHLNHQYDRKLKAWKFVGYRCINCQRMVRADKSVDYHSSRCKKRKLVVLADRYHMDENVIVLGKDRTVWTPLETNQKFSE